MPKINVSVSTQVNAAPDEVWQLVVDLPRHAQWYQLFERFVGDVPDTLHVGVTYSQEVTNMAMPAVIAWQVAVVDPRERLEVAGDAPRLGGGAYQRILVEPSGDGSQVTLEVGFSTTVSFPRPAVAKIEANMQASAQQSLEKFASLLM